MKQTARKVTTNLNLPKPNAAFNENCNIFAMRSY